MTAITETVVEEATLEWLASLGWHRCPGAEALSIIEHNAFA